MENQFIKLCDDYRRTIECITWLETMSLGVWGCLRLQDLYRREVDLRQQIKALMV